MRIRTATTADAPAIASIYEPVVRATAISFEVDPPGAEAMAGRIVSTLQSLPWLVSVDGADAVDGFAYAGKHRDTPSYRWSVNTSIYVREDRRGQGVGKALYGALFDTLAELGYFQAFAGVALPNPASVALHEAVGFEPIGVYRGVGFKLGAWRDVGWWQRPLREPAAPGPVLLYLGGQGAG